MTIRKVKPVEDDFVLPDMDHAPVIIRRGLYTWELKPLSEDQERKVELFCSECAYAPKSAWPLNLSNLKKHWYARHPVLMNKLMGNTRASGLPSEEASEEKVSFLGAPAEEDTSTPNIDTHFSQESSSESPSITRVRARQANHVHFDPVQFRRLMINYLSSHNLPPDHVESESFKVLLSYARTCKNSHLPSITPHQIKADIVALHDEHVNSLKTITKYIEQNCGDQTVHPHD